MQVIALKCCSQAEVRAMRTADTSHLCEQAFHYFGFARTAVGHVRHSHVIWVICSPRQMFRLLLEGQEQTIRMKHQSGHGFY